MVFNNLFKFAQNFSGVGNRVEKNVEIYIPVEPAEVVTQAPHDPTLPYDAKQQDPKIIRETSPQAHLVFGFVNEITQLIDLGAKDGYKAFNEPSTVTDIASEITSEASKMTKSYPDESPSPREDYDVKTELPKVVLPEEKRELGKKARKND
ncbi:TPA: hypothetical protein I9281_003934 [Serratia marcescens]|nr:hypothetical protein [Serratia marcescens]